MVKPQPGDVVVLWHSSSRRPTRTTGVPRYLNNVFGLVETVLPADTFQVRLRFELPPGAIPPAMRGGLVKLRHGEAEVRKVHIDDLSDNLGNPAQWETWEPLTDEEYAEIEKEEEEWRRHNAELGQHWTFGDDD